MNRSIAVGAAIAAGVIAAVFVSKAPRKRVGAALKRRMLGHMEHMMASLPADSPPKLVMSVLPQLREQNEQIIALLREQDALLREHLQQPH